MFTAALFSIAKLWKLPKNPLVDKCIKKVVTPWNDLEAIM